MKTHFYTDHIIDICDNKHLTVEEVFNEVKKKYPDAGKSSIYRNVEELATKGELKKLVGVGKKAYFEKAKHNHIHLIDKNTGKILDLDLPLLNIPDLPNDFKVDDMDLKIFGEFV